MQLDERDQAQIPMPAVPEVPSGLEAARKQVDKILASDTLRASEVLRRLLIFLTNKTFSGETDKLKEYSIGLDALGKPPTYDPRSDAAVRLQASRLRQKLEEYYRKEGQVDPVVIELPKGGFKIVWHTNGGDPVPVIPPLPAAAPALEAVPAMDSSQLKNWRGLAITAMGIAAVLGLVSMKALSRPGQMPLVNPEFGESTAELEALWRPFIASRHHLIIAFLNPLFVRLQRDGSPDILYRTGGNNSWNEAVSSPEFSILRRSLQNPIATPTFNMVERSNLVSTFVLSQFFGGRRGDISLARSDELSSEQFADSDIILFGSLPADGGSAPLAVRPALIVDKTGIRNLQPRNGEPPVYVDSPDHEPSDGEGLELVSMLPGPTGRTTVATFASNRKWGVVGGVQALVDPSFTRVLVQKLREPSGKLPPYYQVVFRIKYRDGKLTSASYVTHRVLALTQTSAEAAFSH
jgi:hypothetical protein